MIRLYNNGSCLITSPSILNGLLLILLCWNQYLQVASIPIDNGLVSQDVKLECMSSKVVDVGFILDASGSIGDNMFLMEKSFVKRVVDRLNVTSAGTRVGMVMYSGTAEKLFGFQDYSNAAAIKRAVDGIHYETGTTRTGNALAMAERSLFPHARGGLVPKVGIVITDGQSQDAVLGPATALRNQGTQLYAIGVTDRVNVDELLLITGDPNHVFTVESFRDLDDTLVKSVTGEMCKETVSGGTATIQCLSNSIGIEAKTRNIFEGNVFVKGHFNTDGCRLDAQAFQHHATSVGITVGFDRCGVTRYRSLNPRGVFVETVVIFSFHPFFITKVDQAIRIQCFYMEAEKTVDTPLEVSMLTTRLSEENVPMPVCAYSLHLDSPGGPIATFAEVGVPVYHRWECVEQSVQKDIYGMLVHSCYVNDGRGNLVQLLDSDGCTLDKYLLNTPEYNSSLRLAVRESHVFKYADKPALQFQCQVTVCVKNDGSCDGITPPVCEDGRKRRSLTVDDFSTQDVLSEQISVLDLDSQFGYTRQRFLPNEPSSDVNDVYAISLDSPGVQTTYHQADHCVSLSLFGSVIGLLLAVVMCSVVMMILLCRTWLGDGAPETPPSSAHNWQRSTPGSLGLHGRLGAAESGAVLGCRRGHRVTTTTAAQDVGCNGDE